VCTGLWPGGVDEGVRGKGLWRMLVAVSRWLLGALMLTLQAPQAWCGAQELLCVVAVVLGASGVLGRFPSHTVAAAFPIPDKCQLEHVCMQQLHHAST
jgi:hypothetical protein